MTYMVKAPILTGSINALDVFTWATLLSSMNEEDKQIFSHLTFRPVKAILLFAQLVKKSLQ